MTTDEAISEIIKVAAELCKEPSEDMYAISDTVASFINSSNCHKARRLKKAVDSIRRNGSKQTT